MRLSAAQVTVGASKLGRTALGANLRGRRAGAEHRRSPGLWRHRPGFVRGHPLGCGRRRQGPVPVHRCRPAILRQRIVPGSASCPAAAISTSRWWPRARARSALAQSLDGTASLTGHDGAISGFNVEQLLKRLERQPLSGGGKLPLGLDALRHLEHRGEIQRRHRHHAGCPRRRADIAPHLDRHRLGARARI